MTARRPEPTSLSSDFVYALRELGSRVRRTPERLVMRNAAREIKISDSAQPLLNYGRLAEVSNRRPIGGEIKLLHLKPHFPEQFNNFNIIYLVSSALPPQVLELVRVAKAQGAKLVWNQNGIAYPGCYGDFYPWFNKTMAELLAMADYIVYQSEFCKASADRYLGIASCPSEILFNPVDLEVFTPADMPPEVGTWELLCAGTNHAFYRVCAPLEALRLLIDQGYQARLTIAGEFRWKGGENEIMAMIEKLGLRDHVRLFPPFSQSEAPKIYRKAHLLIHAKDKDPCPTVPIEAMASGLPIIASASGGMPELVSSSEGRLIPVPCSWTSDHAPDPTLIAEAVVEIMSQRDKYAHAARENAEKSFAATNWLNRHAVIFQQMIQA